MQVREAAMNALDAAQVVYTSDSFKLTVEKVEGLPSKCSGKLMLAEVTYQGAMQATGKKAAKDRNVEYVALSELWMIKGRYGFFSGMGTGSPLLVLHYAGLSVHEELDVMQEQNCTI